MYDWSDARRACSGNLYGRIARFALREGRLYEISRLRGRSSKRHLTREFGRVVDGEIRTVSELEALALAERDAGPTIPFTVDEGTRVGRIEGIGTPAVCGFVLRDGQRTFCLRVGALHEVMTVAERRLILVESAGTRTVSQSEAIARLAAVESAQEPLP